MADLDEEFARFQAELASLETQEEGGKKEEEGKSHKRAREEETTDQKPAQETVKKSKKTEPVVIAAKPVIYSAPPRPVPVRAEVQPVVSFADPLEASSATSATESGALSGFPTGTSGEYAATAGAFKPRPQPVQRVDMVTGALLPADEQHMMNMQQSVYEYDPNKAARRNVDKDGKPKKNLRMAGGEIWEDATLADWPEGDFRLFVGDLGNEVNDEILCHAFSRYASFQRARVVRDKFTHKTKGYGFVSFADPFDCAKAMREMNGKYIGNRPVKIQKSKWQERNIDVARKKAKKKNKHHLFS